MATKPSTKSIAAQQHPLVGRCFHWWQDGAISHQGHIVAVVASNSPAGDMALLEYFEWISGSPTYQRLVPLSAMTGDPASGFPDGWTLYDNADHMNGYYEAFGKHKKARSQSDG